MRNRGELVLVAPADETEPPHHIELLRVQEMQREAPRLVNHIVTKVEFVDVDREARHRRHDRRAHRRIGNHAVLFAGSDGGNRYNWRRQIAQELVGEVRLEHTSRYMATITSLPARLVAHIQATRLFREPGEAIVAVSGGADSVALLQFTHAELVSYAAERGLPVYDDPANRDARHVRSWVRTTLLPLLTERLGPRLRSDLLEHGRHAASDRRAWDLVLDVVPDLALGVERDGFAVARASVCGYDNALSVALLRAAARRVGLILGPAKARQLARFAERPSGRWLPLGSGWTAEVAFDRLRVGREAAIGCALERIAPSGDRGSALFGDFEIQWSPAAAPAQIERATWTTWVDSDAWEVRLPARGDSLVPLGGVGHRPLRRLLMEARVPRSARPRYPVVSRGATILWVPGICRSAAGVPEPGTRAVRLDVTEHGSAQADRRA